MKKPIVLAAVLSALVATGVSSDAGATTITIGDWGGIVTGSEVITDFGTVTLVDVTLPSDGNPGSNIRVETILTGLETFTERFIPFAGATYNPSTQGAAASFDFSFDQVRDPATDGHGWGIGFKQDGLFSFLNIFQDYAPTNQTTYTTYSDTGILASELGGIGFPSGLLNLTPSGTEIQLGLVIFQGNGCCNPLSNDISRYDNFSITFNPVAALPGPGTASLLGLGLVAVATIGRRKV